MQTPKIIYIDDDVIVLDKPAGMPSVSLKEGECGTLATWILDHYPEQKNLDRGVLEAGLVHRLDNETSGLIMAAKNKNSYENIRAQIEDGSVEKAYISLVVGVPSKDGIVNAPIANHPGKGKKMLVCASQELARKYKARPAHTEFKLLAIYNFTGNETSRVSYALLGLIIKTGVRHQIRAHLASTGHPIAGDRLYQNPKIRALDLLKLDRNFLHASGLVLRHPASGKICSFKSPLPDDLKIHLDCLELIKGSAALTEITDPPITCTL